MGAVREGCLVLADISGYTRYLSGVELEHSHDVIADLLGVVTEELAAIGPLAKVEGDAVFVVGRGRSPGGETLLAALDAAYAAFAVRRRTVTVRRTCTCGACSGVGSLDLKLIAHHGEFVEHVVAGSAEVAGPDVILVHRLLKNSVGESTGVAASALLTESCVRAAGLDVAALGLVAHEQAYEDIGAVRGWVRDLRARWSEAEARAPVEVSPEQADIVVSQPCAAPRGRVWEAIVTPEQIVRWKEGATAVEMRDPAGAHGVGTTIHCVHGRQAFEQEVLDWRPFEYFTYRETGPYGPFMWTLHLSGEDDATVFEARVQRLGGFPQGVLALLTRRPFERSLKRSAARLAELVAASAPAPAGPAPSTLHA